MNEKNNGFASKGGILGSARAERLKKVVSEDKFEYDNTLSVNLSAKADANQTASTVGVIGTIITVPVSVVSWIGGAAYGIYAQTTK